MFNTLKLAIWTLVLALFATTAIADKSLPAKTVPLKNISIAKIETIYAVESTMPDVDPENVKQKAITYFSDIPEMIAICECESGFEHYRDDGTLNVNRAKNKKGRRTSSATGACQILYKAHYDQWAKSSKTDITTVEGNFAFARKMFEESGTAPWNESKSCWKNKVHKYYTIVASLS